MDDTTRAGAVLEEFTLAAREAFADDLVSVVLFGSGAEGALRAASDLNVLVVLRRFDPKKASALAGPLRAGQAAARLRAMFLLEDEIPDATRAFAVKFADILRRHRVLFGSDPFAGTTVPRHDLVLRLRQSLLNLTLRLREAWTAQEGYPEQTTKTIADTAGPLRAAAASLLALEGHEAPSPKEALKRVAEDVRGDPAAALDSISAAREHRPLGPGEAERTLLFMIDLGLTMRERAARLS